MSQAGKIWQCDNLTLFTCECRSQLITKSLILAPTQLIVHCGWIYQRWQYINIFKEYYPNFRFMSNYHRLMKNIFLQRTGYINQQPSMFEKYFLFVVKEIPLSNEKYFFPKNGVSNIYEYFFFVVDGNIISVDCKYFFFK